MDLGFITWNIRGLGKAEKLGAVSRLIKKVRPTIVFIQDSKLRDLTPAISRRLCCGNVYECSFSPAIGASGGLISLWNPNAFMVSDKIIHRRFIALFGNWQSGDSKTGLINNYGPSTDSEKADFFKELVEFMSNFDVNWCLGGDFNAFLCCEEKLGAGFNQSAMEIFRKFIQETGLIDLPLKGGDLHVVE
ncbi:hypothetical protein HRI_004160000 [Hibiscus trionum]|uniref:Endonuclease/exonuclease/phosphatase domain-containing protein n=1 Tax=Hibiscus trionum TaxID=183268 RepID=A0A9W7IYK0_HIBTR|nr:hypothetical protein HRI_004160000 [Hibiscus trionum]